MTFRAVLLGLLGAALICGLTYFNDAVMHQTYLVGNNMPISVYGTLIVFVVVLNPVLYLLSKRLSLSGAELAIIVSLTLAACVIPGSGLMRTFTTSIILPHQMVKTNPGWQAPRDGNPWRSNTESVVQKLPAAMLVQVTPENENTVLNGFVQGLSVGNNNIALTQIPWGAWSRALGFWLPLLFTFWVGLLGLSLVVHRQWADHEQLPYPIATFAQSLLPEDGQGGLPAIVRNKLFWCATIPVALFHLNNYICLTHPNMISFTRQLQLSSLQPLFPLLTRGGISWWFFNPTIYFTVIAVAYLLPADVSLSLAIGPVIWGIVVGTLVGYGVSMSSTDFNAANAIAFGAYFGFMLVLLYTGRHYYAAVLKRALFLPSDEKLPVESVWGGRLFLLASVLCTAYISIIGKLDWQLTVVYLTLATMIFLVMSRILAETGAFFIQANFGPIAVFSGLFGAGAIGPQALLIIIMLSTVMLVDPREAFMPFVTNTFKLLDLRKVPVGRFAGWAMAALVLGFAVAVPATLYWQYRSGANAHDRWATDVVPRMPFDGAIAAEQRLQSQGPDVLKSAATVSGWGHFTSMTPRPQFVLTFIIGAGLVLLFTLGRLRFSKWPLHPVLFLVWTTYPAYCFAFSFFLGWLVKLGITRFGGGTTYRNLMPLLLGLIAGDMLGGLTSIIIGAISYLTTGELPKNFGIMPG
jgi:hypothetical protein